MHVYTRDVHVWAERTAAAAHLHSDAEMQHHQPIYQPQPSRQPIHHHGLQANKMSTTLRVTVYTKYIVMFLFPLSP